ncbi:HTH-type transcriptional regulator HdfR [Streptomyces glaucescens]
MDLDLAHVRAFVRAAEELHFGRAAATLTITQQALSKRIARLESLLGTELFQRGGSGVRLTDAGRFLHRPDRPWPPPTSPSRRRSAVTGHCAWTSGVTSTRRCGHWHRSPDGPGNWCWATDATCRR